MNRIEQHSYAKINLRLDVLHKRTDGYHEVSTLMHRINLRDEIHISRGHNNLEIICSHPQVPADDTNLASIAARSLLNRYRIKEKVRIVIDKKIPVAAGLGGGSSNAAATLTGINQLFELGISKEDLLDVGTAIGADVPFFLFGKSAHATGIGEKLAPIEIIPQLWLLLVTPPIQIATPWAYSSLRRGLTNNAVNITIPKCIARIDQVISLLSNDLEEAVFARYPQISTVKDELIAKGAKGSLMSGSGSTVFGIFASEEEARAAHTQLKNHKEWQLNLCRSN
jgi:4-diphosphocytidyl-2-C-methyl-D-erythritol kinase